MLSSTLTTPVTGAIPRHVAIIMDGNGRWAQDRHRFRTVGHIRGVQAVREVVRACARNKVEYLTLFAFSTENWRRPADEVSLLMRLFVRALEREVATLAKQGVRLRVVGNLSAFDCDLQRLIQRAETQTAGNTRLMLTIAANYGGRWDILQATRSMLAAQPELAARPEEITESSLNPYLSMAWAPEPDLFIRTGGEQRISNFLVWQLAYTELYFTDQYWPDFNEQALLAAFKWYETRERRFGRISAQIPASGQAVA